MNEVMYSALVEQTGEGGPNIKHVQHAGSKCSLTN